MTIEPIILDYIRPHDWRQLLRAAALLELAEGDYFDVRAGAIHLWAGPDNKPAGWPPDLRILRGTLARPRSLVGTISYDGPADAVERGSEARWPVMLAIDIADVRDWRWATQSRTWRAGAEAGRVLDDEAWCRRQWQRLKQYAEVGGTGDLRHEH